jgi:hypothetical protein
MLQSLSNTCCHTLNVVATIQWPLFITKNIENYSILYIKQMNLLLAQKKELKNK